MGQAQQAAIVSTVPLSPTNSALPPPRTYPPWGPHQGCCPNPVQETFGNSSELTYGRRAEMSPRRGTMVYKRYTTSARARNKKTPSPGGMFNFSA